MRASLLICLASVTVALSAVAAPKVDIPGLKRYDDSPVYIVFTDVSRDDAKEAVIRMTKMATLYHDRTKTLFAGEITTRLPFYLYSNPQDYLAASGMPGSAGIFTGDSLMAMALRDQEGHVGIGTWHVVQHEGFHQFVHAVIRGDIPTWVDEGLAEYFGESVFTGDGMVSGIVPNSRLKRIQKEIADSEFATFPELMTMSRRTWNAKLEMTHYDQAWSMVHFLATAENGKYQDAFAKFLQLVGKGNPWERAWVQAFGSVEGFETKWKDYWTKMPDNPTLDLYAQSTVAALTSFLARSYSQKDGFDSYEEFVKHDAKDLKSAPTDWLPPSLYTLMRTRAEKLGDLGCKFSFVRTKGPIPQLVCTMDDGKKVVGTFTLNNGRVGKVTAEVVVKK